MSLIFRIKNSYKCTVCGKGFHKSIALKKHLLKHEAVSVEPTRSDASKDLTPSGQSGTDILSTNQTGSGDEEEENVAEFVGIPCPRCDELYRRKDLADHMKDCSSKSDSFDGDSSLSEIEKN